MKRISRKKALFVLFVFLLFCFCTESGEQKEARIGAILPLTGDAASWGQSGKEGIELAISEINSKGGIGGKKLSIIYEDTQAQPEKGASATVKLATVDKVPAIVGDLISATTLAAAPIAERNKVVLLSPTASAPKITEAGKFIFRIWPSDLAEGIAIANFAAQKLMLKKIGVLYIQNDYGIGLKDVFEKEFVKLGGRVTDSVSYKPEETDFRSQLTKLVKQNPEAIYLISYYKDAGLALKQARQLNVKARFLGTTAIQEPKLFEIAGDAADGVIYPLSSGYDPRNQDEVVKAFINKFKEKFGKEPSFVQAQCYDAVSIIAFAMSKGNPAGPDIQKALETLKDYHGTTGTISFDENGDVQKPTMIKIIKGKDFVDYNM